MENDKYFPFTLKWMLPNDGGFCLMPAMAVSVIVRGDSTHYAQRLEFDNGDGTGVRSTITGGRVYVLNQGGKTIETVQFMPEGGTVVAGVKAS